MLLSFESRFILQNYLMKFYKISIFWNENIFGYVSIKCNDMTINLLISKQSQYEDSKSESFFLTDTHFESIQDITQISNSNNELIKNNFLKKVREYSNKMTIFLIDFIRGDYIFDMYVSIWVQIKVCLQFHGRTERFVYFLILHFQ